MKQSVKMWALQTEGGTFARAQTGNSPLLLGTRWEARVEQREFFPTTKVVRVQVDITVVE